MATESSGSNPDFKTRIPGLVDDADIREALKVFLYGEPTVANSAAAAGELTATDGTDGLVGHLNSMRTSLTNASVLKSLYSGSPNKGIILASTGSSAPQAVTVGVDSTVLTADSSEATGVAWKNPTDNLLPKSAGGSHPLTGSLNVAYANPKVIFNDTSSTGIGYAEFQSNSVMKWQIGKNASDSFVINKADTAAAFTINSSGTIVSPSISSPTLTGTVTTPTAGILSNTTVAASTAFVASRFATTNGVENTAFDSAVTPPGIYPGLLHGTNNANGPGGGYWHVLNVEYSGTAGTGNLTQLGLSYSVDSNNTLAMRSRYSGTWSSWQRLATKSYTDSADATKMPLSGGTFSGDVTFSGYATFSNYAYFHYPAHFYNYATVHNAGISTTYLNAAGNINATGYTVLANVLSAPYHYLPNNANMLELADGVQFHRDGGERLFSSYQEGGNRYFIPGTDGAMYLGFGSGWRWATIYSTNPVIATSDAREKNWLRTGLTEQELAASKEIAESIGTFERNNYLGDSPRTHVGVTAQEVERVMNDNGLDPFEYAFLCYDRWEVKDDDNNGTGEWKDSYGVRYEELNQFLMAGQEQRIADQEQRLQALEAAIQ